MHDVVVIGGGPAGYGTAFRAAVRGLDVAMVEADALGGTCLNRGCIPSKTILHVAEVLEQVGRAGSIGLRLRADGIDGPALDAFRTSVMDRMRAGLTGLAEQRTTSVQGRGRIVSAPDGDTPGVVEVEAADGARRRLEGRHLVLCTGSVPATIPGIEVDGEVVMTSDQALWFTEPPGRAVIIGAGAIGMEFASMWAPMGTAVTVVEALDRVLPLEDADASTAVARAFRKRGIGIRTTARVRGVDVVDRTATVTVDISGDTERLEADVVLVAVGRRPHTAGSGAEELGLLDDRGFVAVDDWGRTTVDRVWAAGDVVPTLALAHAGFAEGFVVADAIAGVDRVQPVDHAAVPRVTYCHPEVASVGLTETQARERFGADGVVTATTSFKGNAKGLITGTDGFVKVVAQAGDHGETLGVHVVGPQATDLIGEAALAVEWGAIPAEVAAITHAHPTLYEAMGEAFLSAAGLPFHAH